VIRLATFGLPLVLVGCGIGSLLAPTPEDLSTWQAVPLPPNPELATAALGASACMNLGWEEGAEQEGGPISVVLQDRRTASTAAFIIAGPETIGSCMFSSSGGSAGGSSQPASQLQQLTAAISVDEDGGGGLAGGEARVLGGRASPEVVAVRIDLPDGRNVQASLGSGQWLAWWPGTGRPDGVTATLASGQTEVLVWDIDGWVVR
jgi:hypothetical protein